MKKNSVDKLYYFRNYVIVVAWDNVKQNCVCVCVFMCVFTFLNTAITFPFFVNIS